MRINSFPAIMFLTTIWLVGCDYKGDGAFKENGTWPFKYYTLEFDSFPLKTGEAQKLKIGKIGGNNHLHIDFSLISEKSIQFSSLSPEITLFLYKNDSQETLFKTEYLFKHYHRMVSEGETSWPQEDELFCKFTWDNPEIDNRAVPFKSEPPSSIKELTCYTSIDNPKEELQLEIICKSCEFPEKVHGQLSFSSGWK